MAHSDGRSPSHQSLSRRDPRRERCFRFTTSPIPPAFGENRSPAARKCEASNGDISSTRSKWSNSSIQNNSAEEHKRLISEAEDVLIQLELPYRLLQMCTGDLSFTAASKYDLEVWSPGVCGMAGSLVLLELRRFPGSPGEHPLSARERRTTSVSAHTERFRSGIATYDDRDHGELSAGRRKFPGADGPATLSWRPGGNRRSTPDRAGRSPELRPQTPGRSRRIRSRTSSGVIPDASASKLRMIRCRRAGIATARMSSNATFSRPSSNARIFEPRTIDWAPRGLAP